MRLRQLILLFFLLWSSGVSAQNHSMTAEEADVRSYQLYLNANWNELLQLGKSALKQDIDFPYLRLRMAYAAMMKENYSEALKQYDQVLITIPENEIALYYSKWCRQMLNQSEMASFFDIPLSKLSSPALFTNENRSYLKWLEAGAECSFKNTDTTSRGNSKYLAAKLQVQLGKRMQLTQALVSYHQTISEPWFTGVTNNTAINIFQKEYYGKITIALNRHWMLKTAYHFLYTPFNNYIFYNHAGLVGLKYYGDYYNIQGSVIVSQLSDSMVYQFDLQSDYHPAGNMNLYGSTGVSLNAQGRRQQYNLKQVVGMKLEKRIWLEANATIGKFKNRFENDAYYVYNAIDPNLYKLGINAYWYPARHWQVQLGATFEKRKILDTDYIFNQQSINGGITWKF